MLYSKPKHYKYKSEKEEVLQTTIVGNTFEIPYMSLLDNGLFTVKKGYTWDGSSVPYKKLWVVLSLWRYDPDKHCKTASLIHDALYQAIREGKLTKHHRVIADGIYYALCVDGGMSQKQANIRYKAVRRFGKSSTIPEKNPRNKIYDTEKDG